MKYNPCLLCGGIHIVVECDQCGEDRCPECGLCVECFDAIDEDDFDCNHCAGARQKLSMSRLAMGGLNEIQNAIHEHILARQNDTSRLEQADASQKGTICDGCIGDGHGLNDNAY